MQKMATGIYISHYLAVNGIKFLKLKDTDWLKRCDSAVHKEPTSDLKSID